MRCAPSMVLVLAAAISLMSASVQSLPTCQWSLTSDGRNVANVSLQGIGALQSTVLDVLRSRRAAAKPYEYRVIDIGGAMNSWSAPVVDALLDKNVPAASVAGVTFFQVRDANDVGEWEEVLEHVRVHGKFDFAISTHFLEDIAMPRVVVRLLPRIAEAGFISTPSKYSELSRGCDVNGLWRGFQHHRWIFTFESARWIAYPKIGYLETLPELDAVAARAGAHCWGAAAELSFWWKGHLHLDIVNDDFLGPSVDAVRGYYSSLALNDDCDTALLSCGINSGIYQ